MTRHTKKPKGEDVEVKRYPGASESGVELGKDRATEEIVGMIEKAKPGTVMIISGASELVRTKSTGEIYGDKLKEVYGNNPDYLVITRSEIKNMIDQNRQKKSGKVLDMLKEIVGKNPDKKIIIDFPLFLKEFSMGKGRWIDKDGKLIEYADALLKKHNNNETACLKDWIENEGHLEGTSLQGPNPTVVAEEHLEGLRRIDDIARKFIGEARPTVVGGVGHGWNLDVVAVYLANNGKVNAEGLEKLGGEMIKETELMRLETVDGKKVFNYRGKEFVV